MSETPVHYRVNKHETNCDILEQNTDVDAVRVHLADLERQLISLLVTVQRAQGKEPTVMTRMARRDRQ